VGYGNNSPFILLKMLFQPIDRFCIQMVGRLVQQQHIRFLQQQTTKSYPSTFTSGKICHRLIFRRTTKCVHCTFQFTIQIPCICCINNILQFALTSKKSIHFILVFVILRQTEFLIDFFVFCQCVNNGLHTFHYYFFYCLRVVKIGFLRQITYGIPRREDHFSLIGFL